MIILEGPDCVGKTTLAKALMKAMPGYSYLHHTKPSVHSYEYFTRFLANTHNRVIVDRMHWSAKAYGEVFQTPENKFTMQQWRYLELIAMSRNAHIIYLYDSSLNILDRWDNKREMYKFEDMSKLIEQFDKIFFDTHSEHKSYLHRTKITLMDFLENHTSLSLSTAGRQFVHEIKHLDDYTAELPAPSCGIGYTNNHGFVIIGEALSDNIYLYNQVPRFPWDWGKAPEVLWQAIDEFDIQWHRGYYTNISSFRDTKNLIDTVDVINPKLIISLGTRAGNEVSKVKLWPEHVNMPHPAYVRRFHRSMLGSWQQELAHHLKTYGFSA